MSGTSAPTCRRCGCSSSSALCWARVSARRPWTSTASSTSWRAVCIRASTCTICRSTSCSQRRTATAWRTATRALYDRITEIHSPTTLRDWKIALAKQWAAEEKKRLRAAAQRSDRPAYQRGGGYAAQKTATLHAVSEEGVQGEPHTDEGADDSKQSLAAVGSGRGGRGGRGRGGRGRGRGGGESGGMPSNLTEEQQKWWKEGLCLKCGQSGHRARGCLKA